MREVLLVLGYVSGVVIGAALAFCVIKLLGGVWIFG